MKILIDECGPYALKLFLVERGHECRTVQEAGWAGKKNGVLLGLAEAAFDVFVTIDVNFQHQQNFKGRTLALITLSARTNRLVDLAPLFPACAAAIDRISPGGVVTIK
jgi:hypothetical protein